MPRLLFGEGVGGTTTGEAGWKPIWGVLGGGDGEEKGLKELIDALYVVSRTPRVSMSKLSLMTTVPSARKACSKSKSVRETRRCKLPLTSFEPTGCSPDGNAEGGAVDRGEGWRNSGARM